MQPFLRLYRYINILSLDVVAGAVAGALFFGSILEVAVTFYSLAALALTVWIVYTLDHLRDAVIITRVASTDRHRYHQDNFRSLSLALVILAILDFTLILFLPTRLLEVGCLLGVVVMLYLALQRFLLFTKEFFVASIYTAGILLPSLEADRELIVVHYLLIGKYFVTAWMNLLLFSLVDYPEDRRQQQHSFVTWFGPCTTRNGILLLALVNMVSGLWVWQFSWRVAAVFISMNVMLVSILFFRRHLVIHNYYRIGGDAVFLIPLIYLL